MQINLGVNLSFVGTRWIKPEEWTRIVAEDLKVKYIQFFSDILDPIFTPLKLRRKTCHKIKKLCQRYGIVIQSNFSGTIPHCLNLLFHPDKEMRDAAVKWFENGIEDTLQMGSFGYGSFLGALPQKALLDDKEKNSLIEELLSKWGYLSKVGKEKGLKFMLFEPMSCRREIPSTISETRWWYKKLNEVSELPVYLLIDVGHGNVDSPNRKDVDPYAWVEEFSRETLVVHLQQTDKITSKHWPFTKEYNRKGIIDAERIIKIFQNRGEKEIYPVRKGSVRKSGNDRENYEEMRVGFKAPSELSNGVYFFIEIMYPPFGSFDEMILDHLKESVNYWENALKNKGVEIGSL